jgi:hypothetical protein
LGEADIWGQCYHLWISSRNLWDSIVSQVKGTTGKFTHMYYFFLCCQFTDVHIENRQAKNIYDLLNHHKHPIKIILFLENSNKTLQKASVFKYSKNASSGCHLF